DVITSRANAKVKAAFALKGKGGEAFLVEGFHLVEMAYGHGCLEEVFALEEPSFRFDNVHIVTPEIIDKLASSSHPEPIVGIAKKPGSAALSKRKAVVFDRIQDPGNVGTLLRSALAFGFEDAVFLPGTCSPYNIKAIQASQGAIFGINMVFPSSVEEGFGLLKDNGYRIIGTALSDKSMKAEGYAYPPTFALVLGNEGQGMGEYALSHCDDLLKISMRGIDSLNVGVAGSILMSDSYRQGK
ncbi:MAG: RNA methyltransferase, partial [Bacilli bacterium]|nr:RNA methyltransferase [Bacilli bacterium]